MSDERGFTLVELLIGMMVSMVVLAAIMAMVQVATGDQNRVSQHVIANQRGRPVIDRIIDRIHSACVSPGLAPVRAGSEENSMILYSKSGSTVSPVPNTYVIALASGKLTETVATGSGTEPSNWTFGTPSSPVQLLDGVGTAQVGEPPAAVPLFRYYAYEGGHVATSPLPTPLSAENAAKTVQVNIAFKVAPSAASASVAGAAVTLTDSATLRIEPASEDSAQVNLPCV
ncbi:MAG TPA: prepilin-type N-terminal cleavage/methylation domain-containing protein [Solirubrobacterales bacterium]|nr:prepilin-type N-terminal cleavage/methylation domain-containing protein [Solirubrobacterales bacterium]